MKDAKADVSCETSQREVELSVMAELIADRVATRIVIALGKALDADAPQVQLVVTMDDLLR